MHSQAGIVFTVRGYNTIVAQDENDERMCFLPLCHIAERLGGEDTPEATGTMKAPSFLSAARRILARGLIGTLGPTPAYLRLRAAGEDEVLLRVARPDPGPTDELRLDVVPGDAYRFAERADLLAPDQGADPPAP